MTKTSSSSRSSHIIRKEKRNKSKQMLLKQSTEEQGNQIWAIFAFFPFQDLDLVVSQIGNEMEDGEM